MTSKQFENLSPAERRVAIAKDVIAQIKCGRYMPDTGIYIEPEDIPGYEATSIQRIFNDIGSCRVCEIGGIILSVTKFRNKLNKEDIGRVSKDLNGRKINSILKGVFTPKQLFLIECAFEGYNSTADRYACDKMDVENCFSEEEVSKIDDFRAEYYDDADRMIVIMRNIIKNKGTFKL